MKKVLMSAAFGLLILGLSTTAQANRITSLTAGRCPEGTYAKGGGIYANNVKNCSASNKPFAARFEQQKK